MRDFLGTIARTIRMVLMFAWSCAVAAIWTSGIPTRRPTTWSHPEWVRHPTHSPSLSHQPANRTGASNSIRPITAANGDLPYPLAKRRTPCVYIHRALSDRLYHHSMNLVCDSTNSQAWPAFSPSGCLMYVDAQLMASQPSVSSGMPSGSVTMRSRGDISCRIVIAPLAASHTVSAMPLCPSDRPQSSGHYDP